MSDEEIILSFERRDETAIAAAQEKYGAYCLSLARRIVGSHESGEECINDALNSAWNAIPPARPANLKLYLAAITRNLALNHRQRQCAQKRGGAGVDAVFEELSGCISASETPESVVMDQELAHTINRFLATLSERQRDVFLRRYFFTEQTREIAQRYGLKEGNVLMILSRTRKKLRQYLQKEGYFI